VLNTNSGIFTAGYKHILFLKRALFRTPAMYKTRNLAIDRKCAIFLLQAGGILFRKENCQLFYCKMV
jgi:hypothetical protein